MSRENAMRSLTLRLPKAIDTIGDTMEGRIDNRLRYEAAITIKDTVLGKPKQSIEVDNPNDYGSMVIVGLLKLLQAQPVISIEAESVKLLGEADTSEYEPE